MKLTAYFNLIRWKNLLLIFYVFFLFKFFFFNSFYVETTLSIFQFLILLFSVLFITVAGYIINDIFDVKADEINKPTKLVVSKNISKEQAKQWYKVTNTIGIILGITLCLSISKPTYSFIFIGTSLLLYYYSKILKGKPLIGNLIVSILIAFSVVILPLFDIDFSIKNNPQNTAITIIFALSIFAFILNLIREIIKDIEDINGDKILNLKTLPIIFGRNRAQIIASYLCITPISLVLFLIYNYSSNYKFTMLYLLLFVLIPLLIVAIKLRRAEKKSEFHKLSSLLKIIMFLGITVLFIISFKK
jgi:4-hydroxybenzoate polyprenyltransferase